jgi:hypothetical protein
MVRLLEKSVVGVVAACALVGVTGAGSAYALSPWWHLSSTSRPTYLHPGQARDEVQELTVSATEGAYIVEDGRGGRALLEVGESAEHVREALEGKEALEGEMYGSGNVNVTSRAGANGPNEVYEIEFTGALGHRPIGLLEIGATSLIRGEEQGEAAVREKVEGHTDGQLLVTAVNLGDANAEPERSPITITDVLPAGLEAVSIEGEADEDLFREAGTDPLECSLEMLRCSYAGKGYNKLVLPYQQIQMRIAVNVKSGMGSGEVDEASVTGGGAPGATAKHTLLVGGSQVPVGVNTYEMRAEEEGGGADTQAGSHMFQLTTTILFNETLEGKQPALTKDLHFKLPPGLIGNPTPLPQCALSDFLKNECTGQDALGVARVNLNIRIGGSSKVTPWMSPLYNLVPAVGEPARFGFLIHGTPIILDTAIRTGGDYGVTVNVTNISQTAEFTGSEVTFWGVPGDPRHDEMRGEGCLGEEESGGGQRSACHPLGVTKPPPFLALPTSCTGVLHTTVETDSWKNPTLIQTFDNTDLMPALDGCNRPQFAPTISVAPDGRAGSTPTGLAVAVHVPQDVSLNASGLAEAEVKNTTVALPLGVSVNPAGADGLGACSEEQVALNSPAPPTCPDASKVSLVKIKTPLLPNELEGAVYLASQNVNPFGSLIALYVFAQDPVSGTSVKIAGEVGLNPVTGQVVTTFKNTPQLPFETFELHFFGGDRAAPGRSGAVRVLHDHRVGRTVDRNRRSQIELHLRCDQRPERDSMP